MKANKTKKILYLFVVALATALLMAAGAASSAIADEAGEDPKINAMTRNLYLGADIFKVVEAAQNNPGDPMAVPMAVAEVYNTMLYTNFWARAEALADEIARNKPQVVGLQEVSTFYIQTPGDFAKGNPVEASDLVIDFYEVLNDALLARGMVYDSFEVTNATVELPMVDFNSPTYASDVRMVDRDMVLVRKGHDASPLLDGNYTVNLGLELGGVYVEFTRGFLIVDVDVKGETFRFVNTHLEVRGAADSVFRIVQSLQMQELTGTLAVLSSLDPKPIVMVGDFNSSPEDVPGYAYLPGESSLMPYTPPYMQAVSAGYEDAWLLQAKYDEGYTSGFDEYVSDPSAELTSRIDHIFVDPKALFIDKVKCDIVGNDVSDMIPNPADPENMLWPSDHAGIVGKFKFFE